MRRRPADLAITAAVAGVIVNLAMFFATHVFWPAGVRVAPDLVSIVIATGAAMALFVFRVGVIPVILVAGALGIVIRLSGG